MKLLRNNWTYILGALLGLTAGYLYWLYTGCNMGTCPITSSPTISSIYGAFIGTMVGGLFKIKRNK